METNEIITTAAEEVVEATEEIATACDISLGKAAAIGVATGLATMVVWDYVLKPLAKKIKEKAQQRKAEAEACDPADGDYSDDVIITTDE